MIPRLLAAIGVSLAVCACIAMCTSCTPASSPAVDASDSAVVVTTTPCVILVVDAAAPQGPGK